MNKPHKTFFIILLASFIIRIFSVLTPNDLWWDSSVYIGMGKYIFSLGKVGLWEPNRPLIWPLLLGFFWKIGINTILAAKIIITFFSLSIISLTYFIALKVFDKKIALFSILFLSFSTTFLRFNNILFSEIPSAFLLLFGVYFFLNDKHKLSGLFFGLAFMTRFFIIFSVIPVIALYISYWYKKKVSQKEILSFFVAFSVPLILFLIINMSLYKNPIYPFIVQAYMTRNTGWIYHQPFSFYFLNLFKENIFIVFSIISISSILRKKNKVLILLLFLFPFILYCIEQHKEMRLLIPLFPFLYILTAQGIIVSINIIKKNKTYILSLLTMIWLVQAYTTHMFDKYNDKLDVFYEYMNTSKINDGLWITNPSFIVYSNKKAEELIYYPLYYSEKAKELQNKSENAKAVLLNTCDILPCPPSDKSCLKETQLLLGILKKKMDLIYYQNYTQCQYYIFESHSTA